MTEVKPAGAFWEAEPEHQDYLERIPNGYTCHFVRPNWKLPRRANRRGLTAMAEAWRGRNLEPSRTSASTTAMRAIFPASSSHGAAARVPAPRLIRLNRALARRTWP